MKCKTSNCYLLAILLFSDFTYSITFYRRDLDFPYKAAGSCYVRCMAQCFRKTKEGLSECDSYCQASQINITCKNEDCWSTCNKTINVNSSDFVNRFDVLNNIKLLLIKLSSTDEGTSSDPLFYLKVLTQRITNFNVSYDTSTIEPDPWNAHLSWDSLQGAVLYLIRYRALDYDGKIGHESLKSNRSYPYVITNQTDYVIRKKHLCPLYEFSVAAFNEAYIGSFSEVRILPKPVPLIGNANVSVIESRYLRRRVYQNRHGNIASNNTVRLTIGYRIPNGWSLEDYGVQAIFTKTLLLGDQNGISIWGLETPYPILETDVHQPPLVYYYLPGEVIDTRLKIFTMLDRLVSKCTTVFELVDSCNRSVDYSFSCSTTVDAVCSQSFEPVNCGLTYTNYTIEDPPGSGNISLTVITNQSSVEKDSPKSPLPCYALSISEYTGTKWSIPMQPDAGIVLLDVKTYCTGEMGLNETIRGLLQIGHYYSFKVCAVTSSSYDINWDLALSHAIDLTTYETSSSAVTADEGMVTLSSFRSANVSLTRKHALTIVSITAVALLTFLTIIALIVFFCYKRTKICHRGRNSSFVGESKISDGNSSGKMSIINDDLWETDRTKLIINENQKLGAGAFGSVYRGLLITSRKTSSVDSKNENQGDDNNGNFDATNEVAVKMLPEYADDFSKSEFRKEINLMKNLGHNERLVNMLGCVTKQEPLCLIVEYCSDGDLLHYLREKRSYMIQLESSGVDLCDSNLNCSSIDMDMVVCLRDLISFAWQVSIGLEYLWLHGFIHRDVAARNVLVDRGRKAKIGDFGLCRYSSHDPVYIGRGGKLPIKWMALEAIKNYEFTTYSDVWSFGILLFELITLGGSPYPGIQPSDMDSYLESGQRMEQPDNCPDELYSVMLQTWSLEPQKRPNFTQLRQNLRCMLEDLNEDYLYLKLDCSRDYYNVHQDYPSGQGFSTTASATDGPLIVESPSRKKTTNNNFRTPGILTSKAKSPNRDKSERLQGFLNNGLNLNDEAPSASDGKSNVLGVTNRNYEQHCQTTPNPKLSPAPIGRLKKRKDELSLSSPSSKNNFEIGDDENNGAVISCAFAEDSDDSVKPLGEKCDKNLDDNSKLAVFSASDYSEQNSPVSNCSTTPRLSSTSEQMLIKNHENSER